MASLVRDAEVLIWHWPQKIRVTLLIFTAVKQTNKQTNRVTAAAYSFHKEEMTDCSNVFKAFSL